MKVIFIFQTEEYIRQEAQAKTRQTDLQNQLNVAKESLEKKTATLDSMKGTLNQTEKSLHIAESTNQVINQEKQNLFVQLQSCNNQLVKVEDKLKMDSEAKNEAVAKLKMATNECQTLNSKINGKLFSIAK